MDASDLGPEGFATEVEYRARLAGIDSGAPPQDFLEPKDYVPTDRFADFRETLDDFQFQIEVLKVRMAAIATETVRLGQSASTWADSSAHDQLGAYPWAKLGGAFAATFFGTRLLRMLPLGSMASIAVPLLLRQTQGSGFARRNR